MNINRVTRYILVSIILFSAVLPRGWAEDNTRQNELIQEMIQIVIENSPILQSQSKLVRESQDLPEPGPGFSIGGLNLDVGTGMWNADTNTFSFVPNVSFRIDFSFPSSSKVMNTLLLKKEKEGAKQDYQRFKEEIISDLLSSVCEILMLENQEASLLILKDYLEGQADLMERQVIAGVLKPDELWDLMERIIGIEVEIEDVKTQLHTKRLETALRLGGGEWAKLLEILGQLNE